MKFIDNYINKLVDKKLKERKQENKEIDNFVLTDRTDIKSIIDLSFQRKNKDIISNNTNNKAMDEGIKNKLDEVYNIEGTFNKIIYTHFGKQNFIGYQNCALLNQNWLINKCCSIPVEDAISYDYNINSNDNQVELKDKIDLLKYDTDDKKQFNIKEVCRQFGINKRVFGVSLCIPIFKDTIDMSVPFNIDAIKKNSYLGMSVVDPCWVTPVFDNESQADPVSKDFYFPTYYKMPDGKSIHKSWYIWNTYGIVPDILKPTYFFGGYPLTQLLYERVYCAEKVANEAHMLAMSKRLLVMDGNLPALAINQSEAKRQVDMLSYFRDNWGVAIKDRESNITQIDTSLADFDALLMTQLQLVSSIADIPATKLFNVQPKGFNTSGDYEIKQYNSLLFQIQEQDFIPIIERHYKLLFKSKYNMNIDINIKFDNIDVPTEKEQAEINNLKTQYYSSLLEMGAVSNEEIREELKKDAQISLSDNLETETENNLIDNMLKEEEENE